MKQEADDVKEKFENMQTTTSDKEPSLIGEQSENQDDDDIENDADLENVVKRSSDIEDVGVTRLDTQVLSPAQ